MSAKGASNRQHRLFGSQLAFEHIALVTLRPRSDVMFGEVQAARSPGDNPGFEVCLCLEWVSSRWLAERFGDTCPEGFRGCEGNFLGQRCEFLGLLGQRLELFA
jgi:hypothetical protein